MGTIIIRMAALPNLVVTFLTDHLIGNGVLNYVKSDGRKIPNEET